MRMCLMRHVGSHFCCGSSLDGACASSAVELASSHSHRALCMSASPLLGRLGSFLVSAPIVPLWFSLAPLEASRAAALSSVL